MPAAFFRRAPEKRDPLRMKVRELHQHVIRRLAGASIPDAELEASFLLGHFLKLNRAQLLLHAGDEVAGAVAHEVENSLLRRLQREPLAYIIGEQEFWSLPFYVTPDVLIPRPETELLIEAVLKTKKETALPAGPLLDLATGSGIIAVVLALELPEAIVYSLDCSFPALQVAARNAGRHNVRERLHFVNSDCFNGIRAAQDFALVVSNPPYVPGEELPALQPEVRDFEPHLALDGGKEGVAVIRRIAAQAPAVLRDGGWLFMEIGAGQGEHLAQFFTCSRHFDRIEVLKDYAGHDRILKARRC